MAHMRVNNGWLARLERQALLWLAERTPASVTPDQLTALGVVGAAVTMLGLVLAHQSHVYVLLAIFGLMLNWLGDSLDGTLARYRKIERPRIGYFIDHSCDIISQVFIFCGLGLSPYFTLLSALLALSMYFLISSYTYLKVMIFRSHQLAYAGMGATELRVGIGCWCLFASQAGPVLVEARYRDMRMLDAVVGAAWALIFISFIFLVLHDFGRIKERFEKEESDAKAPDLGVHIPAEPRLGALGVTTERERGVKDWTSGR